MRTGVVSLFSIQNNLAHSRLDYLDASYKIRRSASSPCLSNHYKTELSASQKADNLVFGCCKSMDYQRMQWRFPNGSRVPRCSASHQEICWSYVASTMSRLHVNATGLEAGEQWNITCVTTGLFELSYDVSVTRK